jgi:hypothetical protein
MARNGESRWPSVAQRREQLERSLDARLPLPLKQQGLEAGAALSRDAAFALAFGDTQTGRV